MVMLLVMQSRDNSISFRAHKRRLGRGYRLTTVQDSDNPSPTYIEMGNQAARWLAEHTGGIAQSNILEALGNIPSTAHMLGGAVNPALTITALAEHAMAQIPTRTAKPAPIRLDITPIR